MMFLWFLMSFWLALISIKHLGLVRKLFSKRSLRLRTTLSCGIGWLKLETEAFNDLPTGFLNICGVLHYPSSSQRFHNPKSFDDDGWHQAKLPRSNSRTSSDLSSMKRLMLNFMYDVGALLSVLGVLVALVVLVHLLFSLIAISSNLSLGSAQISSHSPISRVTSHTSSNPSYHLKKRAVTVIASEDIQPGTALNSTYLRAYSSHNQNLGPKSGMMIRLAIPGLTMPSNVIPVFLTALVVSQVTHEAGHALAAALNSVSLQSVGFYLWFPLIPAFYVRPLTLNDRSTSASHDACTHVRTLRVATAGIWHNIVLASFSWLAWNRGLNLFDSTVGQVFWSDLSSEGAVVAHVKQESSLRNLLKPGDLLAQIDGFSLRAQKSHHQEVTTSSERWDDYFLKQKHANKQLRAQGWCFSNPKWQTLSADCCEIHYLPEEFEGPPAVCLKTRNLGHEHDQRRCLTTPEILKLEQNRRCLADVDCPESKTCIEPALEKNFVRIEAYRTGSRRTLFYADAKDLWEEVRVTHLMPRYGFINLEAILTVHELLGFVVSLSLGLAFMNLLPLRNFDGSAICEALISFAASSPLHDDLEDPVGGAITELHSIGHAKPICLIDQTVRTSKEIERSLLYRSLSCLIYLVENCKILGKDFAGIDHSDNTSGQRLISYNQTLRRRETYFRIFQRATTWLCSFVFLGLLILEFRMTL